MKEKKQEDSAAAELKQFEIQFSYVENPEFPKSKTNGCSTVFAETFPQAVTEFFRHYPNAEVWSIINRQRWQHNKHKVIVTQEAAAKLTISHT